MPRKKCEYIMYDNETDLPIFIGTMEECASYVGYTLSSFKTYLSKQKDSFRYSIYNMDKLLEDYDDEEVM